VIKMAFMTPSSLLKLKIRRIGLLGSATVALTLETARSVVTVNPSNRPSQTTFGLSGNGSQKLLRRQIQVRDTMLVTLSMSWYSSILMQKPLAKKLKASARK